MSDKVTLRASGYSTEPLDSGRMSLIFDRFWGLGNQHMPIFPEIIGQVKASWIDSTDKQHHVKNLDELIYAYEHEDPKQIEISGHVNDGPHTRFVYIPGIKRAGIIVTANASIASEFEQLFKQWFPMSDTPIIFISYATEELELADYLAGLIQERVGDRAKVFVAKRSILTGRNPLQTMLNENLLQAKLLIPICSDISKKSSWLWWEASAVWARNGLVCPLFVNIAPSEFGDPVKTLFQGGDYFKVDDLEKMMTDAFQALGIECSNIKLSESEARRLDALSKNSKCIVAIGGDPLNAEGCKRLYSLKFSVTNEEQRAFETLDAIIEFPTIALQMKEWTYPHLRSKSLNRDYTELQFSFRALPEQAIKQFGPNLNPGRTLVIFGPAPDGMTRLNYVSNDDVKANAGTLAIKWKVYADGRLVNEAEKPLKDLIDS